MTARNRLPILLLLLLPGLATAADSASSWLERMNQALHQLDYEGRFVYQHGQTLEAMYLSHKASDGQEREHLLSLNGVAREVIRDLNSVTCIVSRPDAPQVERRPAGRRLAPLLPIRPDQLGDYYQFILGRQERVAGRQAQVVRIVPLDNLRYGYRLALDTEHALPLATATIDAEGRRISQLLFTDLQVGGEMSDDGPSLAPDADVTRTVQLRQPVQSERMLRWRFHDLPGGFRLSQHRRRLMGSDDHEVEHFIFSDGLATVSVYVEEARSGADRQPQDMSRLGAVMALSRHLPGYQVTAVGEVPQQALQRFLDGIEPQPGAP